MDGTKDQELQPERAGLTISAVSPVAGSLLAHLDERIINASSPEEALDWAQVRREVAAQDEERRRQQQEREILARQVSQRIFLEYCRWGFALLSFFAGSFLGLKGYGLLGIFMVGAALSVFAENWVLAWLKGGKSDEGERNGQ
jgi:hypothetical protein